MLSVDCQNCDGRCCTSRRRELYVVLIPGEEDRFKDVSIQIKTSYGGLTVLKKSELGDCIFYDRERNLCHSYESRPFECRMYPLQMYFDFAIQRISFGLDSGTCHKTGELSLGEIERIKEEWIKQHLSLDWIKAYSTFDNPQKNLGTLTEIQLGPNHQQGR